MATMNCNKFECPNWGTLIVDANVFIYGLSASLAMVEENEINQDWPARLPKVGKVFEECLGKIKKCSFNGQLCCSEKVLNEELDTNGLIKGTRPPGRSRSVYNAREISKLRQILCSHSSSVKITMDSEIRELRSQLSNRRAFTLDCDISILVAALKASQAGIPTLVVSQDSHFEIPVQILTDMGSCTLQGVSYTTTQLIWRTYLGFITKAHDCCSLSTNQYEKLYNAWCFSVPERIASEDQQLAYILKEQFVRTQPVMQKSIEYKDRT
jgi:hypothetical protein